MISSRDIAKEINEKLRDVWTDQEWKNGKNIEVEKAWAGRMKFITEQYEAAGWVVTTKAEISSGNKRVFFMNFKNPMSFKDAPKELRDTGVKV